jgi:hypothetical protein
MGSGAPLKASPLETMYAIPIHLTRLPSARNTLSPLQTMSSTYKVSHYRIFAAPQHILFTNFLMNTIGSAGDPPKITLVGRPGGSEKIRSESLKILSITLKF